MLCSGGMVDTINVVPRSPHVAKLVRFPPDVYEQLVKIAEHERRSVTAQIVRFVEEGLERARAEQSAPPRKRAR